MFEGLWLHLWLVLMYAINLLMMIIILSDINKCHNQSKELKTAKTFKMFKTFKMYYKLMLKDSENNTELKYLDV